MVEKGRVSAEFHQMAQNLAQQQAQQAWGRTPTQQQLHILEDTLLRLAPPLTECTKIKLSIERDRERHSVEATIRRTKTQAANRFLPARLAILVFGTPVLALSVWTLTLSKPELLAYCLNPLLILLAVASGGLLITDIVALIEDRSGLRGFWRRR